MKKRSMLAIASLATGFVVAAVTPSHSAESSGNSGTGSPAAGLPDTGGQMKAAGLDMGGQSKLGGLPTSGQTKVAGISVDRALDTVGKAINRETDRAVNNAPHGKKR
ncbi:hypothetical protein [Streptomyces cyaneus]|uniref:hypothetical protein n=1 Tax=Streptomyces cyaneus TaxID=1904 RepID=UPI000FF89F56|nr:hypothetical protein [Streptomyces cyaneus]